MILVVQRTRYPLDHLFSWQSCFGYTKHLGRTCLCIVDGTTHRKCMFLSRTEPDDFLTIVLMQHQFPRVLAISVLLHCRGSGTLHRQWCREHHVCIKCRVHNPVGGEGGTHVEYVIYYRGVIPLVVVQCVPLHSLSCTALTKSRYAVPDDSIQTSNSSMSNSSIK